MPSRESRTHVLKFLARTLSTGLCRFMIDMKNAKINNIYMKRSALATMNENYDLPLLGYF